MFEERSIDILKSSLSTLAKGYEHLPEFETQYDPQKAAEVMARVAERMWDNYPYPHPQYAGQMLKPPHPIARMAYMMAMWINPNNHALDGGKASSAMEKEVVQDIAKMFGWTRHLGHLTSGGTMANLEALWVASQCHPDKKVVASRQAHYTHSRICGVLKVPFASVDVDDQARMDMAALEALLKAGDVGTVVVTLGTTGVGAIDPLPDVLRLQSRYGFRIHVDAAYGGYFKLVDALPEHARKAYACIDQADSIVIDPHKHGLQPYGCGCIVFKDPAVGAFYKHDSPYTYFSSDDLHLGEISLECSRAGASAVALWATMQMLPITREGEFARGLGQCRQAAVGLYDKLTASNDFIVPLVPDLDIVIWAPKAGSTSEVSRLSQQMFEQAEAQHLYLAAFNYPSHLVQKACPGIVVDSEHTVCLRSALMKPEHLEWLDTIWETLTAVHKALK